MSANDQFEAIRKYRNSDYTTRKQYRILKAVLNNLFALAEQGGSETAKVLLPVIESIEFAMQDVLGLPKNKNYHRYWKEIPGCTCPYIDNVDYFGTDTRIHSNDCPYHGVKKEYKYVTKDPILDSSTTIYYSIPWLVDDAALQESYKISDIKDIDNTIFVTVKH